MSLADKLASKLTSKSNQGTYGLMVRDSHWHAMGALVGFISNKAIKKHILIALSIAILSLCLANNSYATSSSITITLDDNIVDLNVAPTTNGAFSKSSASKIGVATTNYTGYTLSISASGSSNSGSGGDSGSSSSNGSNNPTALINGDKSLLSIENALTEEQFKALDSTVYNNMWGYLPSKYNSETNTSFLPSPSTNGDILDITSTANTVDNNTGNPVVNEYEITLGARVDTTASLGSYSNVFLVEAVANAIPYTINYLDDMVGNMPVDVSDSTTDTTVTISSNAPTRNGYTFIGWCTIKPTNNTNGTDTCPDPGVQVSAGGTIALDSISSNNNFTLHAMWSGNYTIDALVASGATMQDLGKMSTENKAKILSTMVTDTNYILKDSRDQQDYTIAKLKDGNIWMTKNLNLAGGTTLTPSDTDFDPGWILPTNNGFQAGNKLPVSSATGFSDNSMAYIYNTNRNNPSYCSSSPGCYSYYSWITATLGSGLSLTTNDVDAQYSICPKEWRLPNSRTTITGDSDFYKLAITYGMNSSNVSESASTFYGNAGPNTTIPNILMPGFYVESHLASVGNLGTYWSSTSYGNANHARSLDLRQSSVDTVGTSQRRNGFSVRCILK